MRPGRIGGVGALVQQFQGARRDPALTVLEGFHAVKHAVRFGAELRVLVTTDADEVARLADALAPDVRGALAGAVVVEPHVLAALAPRAPRTGVMAVAVRPTVDLAAALAAPGDAPAVLLEDPRTMGNVGACVRVAAAAGAAAVLTTGTSDPWHPDAVRGGAGLQYALPVARLADTFDLRNGRGGRPLVALDPEGDELRSGTDVPARALLAFGTERDGLSDELLDAADLRIALPMEAGVSSLNLATSVAATLYAWRLHCKVHNP